MDKEVIEAEKNCRESLRLYKMQFNENASSIAETLVFIFYFRKI